VQYAILLIGRRTIEGASGIRKLERCPLWVESGRDIVLTPNERREPATRGRREALPAGRPC